MTKINEPNVRITLIDYILKMALCQAISEIFYFCGEFSDDLPKSGVKISGFFNIFGMKVKYWTRE
jgi:hypothetical protein